MKNYVFDYFGIVIKNSTLGNRIATPFTLKYRIFCHRYNFLDVFALDRTKNGKKKSQNPKTIQ